MILKLIKEIKNGIYKALSISIFLNAAIIYLIVYFILMLFKISSVWVSLGFALIYLLYEFTKVYKKDPLIMVESRYSDINEELRTLEDNLDKKNELIDELKREVTQKVKRKVDIGDFVNFRDIISKTLVLFFMSFLIILIASLNIRLLGPGELVGLSQDLMMDLSSKILDDAGEKMKVVFGDNNLKSKFNKIAKTVGVGGDDIDSGDIFGESEVVNLGNNKVQIKIKPTEYELSVDDYQDPERQNFQSHSLSKDDVFLEKGYALEENIPREKQDIVRRYFQELSKN